MDIVPHGTWRIAPTRWLSRWTSFGSSHCQACPQNEVISKLSAGIASRAWVLLECRRNERVVCCTVQSDLGARTEGLPPAAPVCFKRVLDAIARTARWARRPMLCKQVAQEGAQKGRHDGKDSHGCESPQQECECLISGRVANS